MRQRHIPRRHRGRPHLSGDEKLYLDMRIRVCIPEHKDIVWRTHSPTGRGYTEANLDNMLKQAADYLEKKYPSIEFRMVELAPNHFNFIYHGRKEPMSKDLNRCPEIARSPSIAASVCAKDGHKLSVFQNGMQHTQQGPIMQTINFCSNCGLSLAEVRGDLDVRIDAAVNEGVQKRLNAAANAKPAGGGASHIPAGQPGIEIVPDVKAKAAVESPS